MEANQLALTEDTTRLDPVWIVILRLARVENADHRRGKRNIAHGVCRSISIQKVRTVCVMICVTECTKVAYITQTGLVPDITQNCILCQVYIIVTIPMSRT